MDISGKVALVTGGGSGIGRAICVALARAGAQVAVVDIDEAGGGETVRQLRSKGGKATFVAGDVSSPAGITGIFDAVSAAVGKPQIVHNNAGIMTADTPGWPEASLERVYKVVTINAAGVIMGTRQAVALMKDTGGVVINTASTTALTPLPRDAVYASTKALVVHFTHSCAELAESHGVRVNAIVPNATETPIIAKTGDGVTMAPWLAPLLEGVELIKPEAVAACALDLIRDDKAAGICRVIDFDGERDLQAAAPPAQP